MEYTPEEFKKVLQRIAGNKAATKKQTELEYIEERRIIVDGRGY